jgi:hypothetical protein
VSCRPNFFLPVRVLSRLFRRLFLKMLIAAHEASRLPQLRTNTDRPGILDAKCQFRTFARCCGRSVPSGASYGIRGGPA